MFAILVFWRDGIPVCGLPVELEPVAGGWRIPELHDYIFTARGWYRLDNSGGPDRLDSAGALLLWVDETASGCVAYVTGFRAGFESARGLPPYQLLAQIQPSQN